jgi:8-oxo-dGTP diphosphatase
MASMKSEKTDVVYASGVVPWRRTSDGEIEILLIHRPRYDDWSVPKGKRDKGETDELCAVREMQEETGFSGELGKALPTAMYTDHRGRPKEVAYWLMEIAAGEPRAFEANDEVDELAWFRFSEAQAKLSYPLDQALLDEALLILNPTDV